MFEKRSRMCAIDSSRLARGNSFAVLRRSTSTPNASSAIRISVGISRWNAGVGAHASRISTITASPE